MPIHGQQTVVLAFVLTSIATVVVALRFYSRHFLVGGLDASDWVMFAAIIATWTSVVINWYMIYFQEHPNANKTGQLLMFWVFRLSYILDIALIKTSILIFYYHIAESRKLFRYVVSSLLALVILTGIGMFVAGIFICHPISDAWTFNPKGDKRHCYDPTMVWRFHTAFNLVTDVLVWVLPIFFFLNLRLMSMRRRLGLVAIFSLGLAAIVSSACRLYVTLHRSSKPVERNESTFKLLMLSQIEQHTGIIAASIPFLRPLVRQTLGMASSRENTIRSTGIRLDERGYTPKKNNGMSRTLIIPSPSPTCEDNEEEFQRPSDSLAPIKALHSKASSTWGSTIWDGSQDRLARSG